jgi:6-pyruvoyl tetrahydropterin synthase/QueD family protein
MPGPTGGISATLDVRLGFEAAHRLPALGGKCANLHGHSWTAEFTLSGVLDSGGIVADLGEIKATLRRWIDDHLDHAALLGWADPLTKALEAESCRVFTFGHPNTDLADLPWPSTEAVAVLLYRVADDQLTIPGVSVVGVRVTEAPTIAASHP